MFESEDRQEWTDLAKYYVPSLAWLPAYDWAAQFPTDFLAGLTVSVLIIPQAIAYSGIAGLPPAYGLYTSIFPALLYFLLGSCRQMSVGPESTSAILMGHVLSKMLAEIVEVTPSADTAQLAIDIAFRVTFLSGCLCLAMGLARVGFVDSILSQPILEGFVSAVACLLLTDQIPKLLGLPMGDISPETQGLDKWRLTWERLGAVHFPTLLISIGTIGSLVGLRAFKSAYSHRHRGISQLPELFFVLLGATAISSYFQLSETQGVAVLGSIQSGFLWPRLPSLPLHEVSSLLSTSLSIAILGFVDSGLVARIYAQKHGYFVSSNRELVALGSANIVGSMFGSFPAYGSLTRTKLASNSGATSQMAMLCCAVMVAIVAVAGLPYLAAMPRASISAMILLVAFSLLDVSAFRFLIRIGDKKDAGLYLAMTTITFLYGVDVGLTFAFAICLLLLVKITGIPSVQLLGRTALTGEYLNLEDPRSRPDKLPNILCVKVAGSLHFANGAAFKSAVDRFEKFGTAQAHPGSKATPYWSDAVPTVSVDSSSSSQAPYDPHVSSVVGNATSRHAVVLDLSECVSADSTAIHILLDMMRSYVARDETIVLLVLRQREMEERLLAAGCASTIAAIFRSVKGAVEFAEKFRDSGEKHLGGYESFRT
jgi:high affinity sulfate transporter 1